MRPCNHPGCGMTFDSKEERDRHESLDHPAAPEPLDPRLGDHPITYGVPCKGCGARSVATPDGSLSVIKHGTGCAYYAVGPERPPWLKPVPGLRVCEQCQATAATVYAGGPRSGDWAGYYCEPCASRLGFQVWDRLK